MYMAKYHERQKARILRQEGQSIRSIALTLNVSKSSVSHWCSDIPLSQEMTKRLLQNQQYGGSRGRLKGARLQKQRRINEELFLLQEGTDLLKVITNREFFFAGLGIYWGEGFKSHSRTGICNADPQLITFMLRWFHHTLDVPFEDFRFHVSINEIHLERIDKVLHFWYKVTGASPDQFTKTTYIKSVAQKVYDNHETYYGTLRVTVRKSTRLHRKIIGLLEGLKHSEIMAA